MPNHVCIITGVSSGLGAELANNLLEDGNTVIGLSRTNNEVIGKDAAAGKYYFYPVDLTHLENIKTVVQNLISAINQYDLDSITLINNAASVTPLKEIHLCSDEEIMKNIQLNLVAPMLLTSTFIRLTSDWRVGRKIVNILSGSGEYPAPSMSLYCSAKAAMNMFSQCIGMEQDQGQAANKVQIYAVDPGMMDTPMQQTARESDTALAKYFADQKAEGNLMDPANVANQIIKLLRTSVSVNGGLYPACELEE
ncbi:benzil reductase ((S)-benzoin forming) [Paenibacillus sp. BK033]|uniref:SDR family NAD(P)-dependent oxidoreductase n=1 Tax=Paenibacillus sp. BK033 TaxID=2512133 RepID=UPI001052410F|nr:SDR family NAD(P)-dependent oxidoreductase [Paenibacillus sp. BK033]TCM96142.1 benzil reductase ((S)-benzoin forming) [Paenibacillus sp. BK033]